MVDLKKLRKKILLWTVSLLPLILLLAYLGINLIIPDYFTAYSDYSPTWIAPGEFIFLRLIDNGSAKIYKYSIKNNSFKLLKKFSVRERIDLEISEDNINYRKSESSFSDEVFIQKSILFNPIKKTIRQIKTPIKSYVIATGFNTFIDHYYKIHDNKIDVKFIVHKTDGGESKQVFPEVIELNENSTLYKEHKEDLKKKNRVFAVHRFVGVSAHIASDEYMTFNVLNYTDKTTGIYLYNYSEGRIVASFRVNDLVSRSRFVPEKGCIYAMESGSIYTIDVEASKIEKTEIKGKKYLSSIFYCLRDKMVFYYSGNEIINGGISDAEFNIPRYFEIRSYDDLSKPVRIEIPKYLKTDHFYSALCYFDIDEQGENIVFYDSETNLIYNLELSSGKFTRLTNRDFRTPLYKLRKNLPFIH